MISDKNWKFPLCFIFNTISLEIKSNDHLVRKQAPPLPQTEKNGFYIVAILGFFQGVSP